MLFFAANVVLAVVAASQLSVAIAAAAPAATIWSVVTAPTDAVETTDIKGTTIIKPVATLDGGAVTQYAEVIIESLVVIQPPPGKTDAPFTLLTQPATVTSTFEQGSATLGFHRPAETESLGGGVTYINDDRTRNCTIDPSKLEGSCVEVAEIVMVSGGQLSTTFSTSSFSGSLMPIATITPGSSSAMSLASNGALIGMGLSAVAGLVFGLA